MTRTDTNNSLFGAFHPTPTDALSQTGKTVEIAKKGNRRWAVPLLETAGDQWKESPHAQLPEAFGLSIVKPCFWIVSSKSMVAPSR